MPSWLRVRGEFRERCRRVREQRLHRRPRRRLRAQSRPSERRRSRRPRACRFKPTCRMRASPRKQVGPTTAPFRGPFDLRSGLCRHRRRQGAGRRTTGTAGARLRRAAAARTPRLGEHRPVVGRRARDPAGEVMAGRRVRRLAGAQPPRRVRQERQRQPARRRVCRVTEGDPAGGGRAVSVLAPRREPAQRADRRRRSVADDDGRARRGQAAGTARLRRRDGDAARIAGGGFRERLGGTLADSRVAARGRRRQADVGIQLRHRRRQSDRRHVVRPSTSSIQPATTSSGSPIRSAGATCITFERGSSSRRSKPRRSH